MCLGTKGAPLSSKVLTPTHFSNKTQSPIYFHGNGAGGAASPAAATTRSGGGQKNSGDALMSSAACAAAALSPVPEIFFSGAVAAGIPGPLCWLRFLHGDESSNAQQRRSAAATDPIKRSVPAATAASPAEKIKRSNNLLFFSVHGPLIAANDVTSLLLIPVCGDLISAAMATRSSNAPSVGDQIDLMEPRSSAYQSKTGSDPFSSPINPLKIRSVRSPSITPIML
ncbi:hypothetical protein MRB53_036079 [Persea americana]|uniref:Uncharacterized protein n=1 Tax=Persea americana TaxID=3435 RepID=A0ACC2K6H0_PERAE|nr:hypothetical protein MRB53_036079 [Persea americana]